MATHAKKLEKAKKTLGSNWVLAKQSTYTGEWHAQYGMCRTLHTVVQKAMKAGRL